MNSTKTKTLLVNTSLLYLLAACSYVPLVHNNGIETQEILIETPESFAARTNIEFQSADDTHWVSQFNSPELEGLIINGLENNPSLAATATRIHDSQVIANITSSSRLPNLNAGLTAVRAKSNTTGTTFIGDNFEMGFSSQWEIDLWGKLRDQTKADRLQAEAMSQQYNAAKLSLSASIAKAYFNLLTETELLKLSQQNTHNIEQIESISVRSFKRGLVNALDVQLARRDLASSKRALLAQENSSEIAARTLDILLGDYPAGKELTNHSLPALPNSIAHGVPAQVLERRPDLQAAALKMLASEADVAAARSALLPSIVLSGSAGTSTNDLKNIFDKDFSVWSLLGNLAQPLLNRTALKGNLQLEKNAQERAKLEYIDLALSAMYEVENSLATENSLRQQVTELTTARDYAKQSRNQAKQQYEKGLVDANTLLSTETQYLNTEQALLQIQNQSLQNRVTLYVALGGDTGMPISNSNFSTIDPMNSSLAIQNTADTDITTGVRP